MSHFKGPDIDAALPRFRPKTSVLKLIEESLFRNNDAIAMVEGQSGKTASFRQILQQSVAVAAGLRSAGVTAGDYVVICGDKSILAYSLLLGTMFSGATAILYPIPHVDILHKLTNGFHIKAVFCDAALLEPLTLSMSHLPTSPLLVGTMDYDDEVVASLLRTLPGDCGVFEVKDVTTHVPLVLFSSGTTGEPKGILITDRYVQLSGVNFNFKCKAMLTASPLFWLSGLIFFISSAIYNYKVVFSNSSKPSENLHILQKYQVDGWFTGTGSLSRYINEPTLPTFDLSALQNVFTGGEYVLTSTLDHFVCKVLRSRQVNLRVLYGNTEAGMLSTYQMQREVGNTEAGMLSTYQLKREHGRFKTGACGKLCPGVEVKIVDDSGNVVPRGCVGAVLCKSLALTPGYWGRPDLNNQLFTDDGFLITGDAGFFDDDANLYVQGRVGDLINFRGIKISPAEVEGVLMSHAAVLDAAVVSKPHPSDIHHFTAFVVLNPNTSITAQELQEFVNDKVEDDKKLRGGVQFLDVLPRTVIGKVQRKSLRELSLSLI